MLKFKANFFGLLAAGVWILAAPHVQSQSPPPEPRGGRFGPERGPAGMDGIPLPIPPVLDAIDAEATGIDDVAERCGLPVHRVLSTLSVLEMRHLIRRPSPTTVWRV